MYKYFLIFLACWSILSSPLVAQDLFLEDLLREMESELKKSGENEPASLDPVKKSSKNTLEKDVAVLRGLDKVTARIEDFNVPVGSKITFHGLEITVRSCQKKPPEEMPESAVFLEIHDIKSENRELFKGWMFASSPALSALQHPTLDIWLTDCFSEEVKEETISPSDSQ